MRITIVVGVVLLFAACTGAPEEMPDADLPTLVETVDETSGSSDVIIAQDGVTFDVGESDQIVDELTEPDVTVLNCESGQGCFLDKCTDNTDCQAGWCVDHLGEGVCSKLCQEECPPGWSCQQVAGTDPDVIYICISDYTNLCRPCANSNDCKSDVGAEDVCVSYGAEGSFCGGGCGEEVECPWGFSCQEVETVDNIVTTQCVVESGVCPCTAKSVALSLWTPCEIENETGICEGKRICSKNGLTACDAQHPAQEICNGLDDDCDGEIDEPALIDGNYLSLCDDSNPCSDDACKGEAGCDYTILDSGECMDGDPCTIADHCEQGICVGKPVDCDDDNPCTEDICTEDGGCEAVPTQEECDDGDPCTVGDHCIAENCQGTAIACDCQTDDDCVELEDGNLCNGTLACDKNKLPYVCAVVEESVVSCPVPEGLNALCLVAHCAPETGDCAMLAAHDGNPCDNDNLCDWGDSCEDGECVAGPEMNCNDGNPCTTDSCESTQGCLHANNNVLCDDNDLCTVDDICQDGICQSGNPLDCDDDNVCTNDLCLSDAGCVHLANQANCDDGNECTTGDQCNLGNCIFTGVKSCDDSNPCTIDTCDAQAGCSYESTPGVCSDGDPCTQLDTCDSGLCKPGLPVDCDDGNTCTADSCGETGSCLHEPVSELCSDGNECTTGDHCSAGECIADGELDCTDLNPCTDEYCNPLLGCISLLNDAFCDDGDLCTTGDHCHLGQCISAGQLTCIDGNPCTADSCEPDLGCSFSPNQEPCDDGNACTTQDNCQTGVCLGSGYPICDDNDECTGDACDPATGCVHPPLNDTPCEDGDGCTLGDICTAGVCTPGQEISCDDGNTCTDDLCVPVVGCVNSNNSLDCDDSNLCTTGDFCAGGSCQPGPEAYTCSDGNECTDDWCDEDANECKTSTVVNATSCDNGTKWCWDGDCVEKQTGVFCLTGPEKGYMSGKQICNEIYGLPCGPTATKTYHASNCQGSIIDNGRGCHEMPLDPYSAGSAALVCGQ